jgi:hypothetical protein
LPPDSGPPVKLRPCPALPPDFGREVRPEGCHTESSPASTTLKLPVEHRPGSLFLKYGFTILNTLIMRSSSILHWAVKPRSSGSTPWRIPREGPDTHMCPQIMRAGRSLVGPLRGLLLAGLLGGSSQFDLPGAPGGGSSAPTADISCFPAANLTWASLPGKVTMNGVRIDIKGLSWFGYVVLQHPANTAMCHDQ